jgi:uncharacterized protein DUF5615
MKLLFDQNLSFKLCTLLSDLFPDSKPIRELVLFEHLIRNETLASLIPKLFSHAFDTFPEDALLRAIDVPGVDFGELLTRLEAVNRCSWLAWRL